MAKSSGCGCGSVIVGGICVVIIAFTLGPQLANFLGYSAPPEDSSPPAVAEAPATPTPSPTPEPEYGEAPVFAIGNMPSAVSRVLRPSMREPASLELRSVDAMELDVHDGVKCHRVRFTFAGKNGFGGVSLTSATAWMRGSRLVDLRIEQ